MLHLRWQCRARFQGALEQVLAIGLQLEATHGLHRIGALLELGHQFGVEAGEFHLGVGQIQLARRGIGAGVVPVEVAVEVVTPGVALGKLLHFELQLAADGDLDRQAHRHPAQQPGGGGVEGQVPAEGGAIPADNALTVQPVAIAKTYGHFGGEAQQRPAVEIPAQLVHRFAGILQSGNLATPEGAAHPFQFQQVGNIGR